MTNSTACKNRLIASFHWSHTWVLSTHFTSHVTTILNVACVFHWVTIHINSTHTKQTFKFSTLKDWLGHSNTNWVVINVSTIECTSQSVKCNMSMAYRIPPCFSFRTQWKSWVWSQWWSTLLYLAWVAPSRGCSPTWQSPTGLFWLSCLRSVYFGLSQSLTFSHSSP